LKQQNKKIWKNKYINYLASAMNEETKFYLKTHKRSVIEQTVMPDELVIVVPKVAM
jgi:hypothetical protein